VLGVVRLCSCPVEGAKLQRGDPQTLALDPADDLTDQSASDAVGLDQDKGSLSSRHGSAA
jgi:hypothetical protein